MGEYLCSNDPQRSHDFNGWFTSMALAASPLSGVWLAGSFRNSIAVPTVISSNGDADIFTARIAGDQLTLPNRVGGGNNEEDVVLTVDATGGPYVAARFNGTLPVGIFSLMTVGSDDVALIHWSASGSLASARSFGGTNPDVPSGIAVVDDLALVAGWYNDSYVIEGCTSDGGTTPDNFLFAFDDMLACTASKNWGDPNSAMPARVAALGDAVIVAGTSDKTLGLVRPPVQSLGARDIYLARVQDFTVAWSHVFGDPFDQVVNDVVACGDRIVMVGSAAGTVDFGSGPKPSVDPDAFVAAFDASGNPLWDARWRSLSVGSQRNAVAAAIDADCQRVVVFGTFSGGIDFGSNEIPAISSADLFVAELAL